MTVRGKYWLLICLFFMLASAAYAAALDMVEVSAPDINCIFDSDCTITVTDSTADIPLVGSFNGGFVQSRTFPTGEPGTPGAGLYAYLYRVDMRQIK